jgi:hypothetical protein
MLMPLDENGEEYMTLDQFLSTTEDLTPDPSPDNIARALQYMDWWLELPDAPRMLGSQAHHDIRSLMLFARLRLAPRL